MAIIQWVSEEDELDDIYYYNIRLGIEKRAQELDYEILFLAVIDELKLNHLYGASVNHIYRGFPTWL